VQGRVWAGRRFTGTVRVGPATAGAMEGRVGRSLRKLRGKVWTGRTHSLPGGGGPDEPRWRVAAVDRDGVSPSSTAAWSRGICQRADWNSSRLGVRTARRSKFLSVGSLQRALTRSRTESGIWPNRVSRASIIASRAVWRMPFSRLSTRPSFHPSCLPGGLL